MGNMGDMIGEAKALFKKIVHFQLGTEKSVVNSFSDAVSRLRE